jgi:rubrerythrin
MASEDVLEEVFRSIGEYFASSNENIMKGVTIGIELETKGRDFYLEKYNQLKIELFQFLADEELRHLRALENVKEIIDGRGQWVEVKEVQLKQFGRPNLFKDKLTEPRITEESSCRDTLLAARSVERRSKEFYDRMSEKVKDEDAKKFFTALASFEMQHFEMIDKLLPKEKEGGVISRLNEGQIHKHTRPRRFR